MKEFFKVKDLEHRFRLSYNVSAGWDRAGVAAGNGGKGFGRRYHR